MKTFAAIDVGSYELAMKNLRDILVKAGLRRSIISDIASIWDRIPLPQVRSAMSGWTSCAGCCGIMRLS